MFMHATPDCFIVLRHLVLALVRLRDLHKFNCLSYRVNPKSEVFFFGKRKLFVRKMSRLETQDFCMHTCSADLFSYRFIHSWGPSIPGVFIFPGILLNENIKINRFLFFSKKKGGKIGLKVLWSRNIFNDIRNKSWGGKFRRVSHGKKIPRTIIETVKGKVILEMVLNVIWPSPIPLGQTFKINNRCFFDSSRLAGGREKKMRWKNKNDFFCDRTAVGIPFIL